MSSTATTEASRATQRGDYFWGWVLLAGLIGVVGLIVGVVRWLNPDPKVLATLTLDGGVVHAPIALTEPCELHVLLNVRALREMDRGDLQDDLARSQLTLTTSNPEATARCSAYNGWSNLGSDDKRKRVPRITEAESRCSLKAAPGQSQVSIEFEWKGKSERPRVTALLVTP